MPDFTVVTVTETYESTPGIPSTGYAIFTPSAELFNTSNWHSYSKTPYKARLVNGVLTAPLIALNDLSTSPIGATWTVAEYIDGIWLTPWTFTLTVAQAPTVALYSLKPGFSGSLPLVPAVGMTRANYPKWQAALANVVAGTGYAKLLCCGDSTTLGAGTVAPGTLGVPAVLAGLLNSLHPTQQTFSCCPDVPADDPRWTLGAGWANALFGFAGNACITSGASGAGVLSYLAAPNCDTFDVWYLDFSSGGGFSVAIDGGSPTSLVVSGATVAPKKLTVTAAAGVNHNVNIVHNVGASAAVWILGVDAYLSTTKSIHVGNAGVIGSHSNDWQSATTFSSLQTLTLYAADLTILQLGINDAFGAGIAPATYLANMQAIITAAQLSGDVLLWSPNPVEIGMGWSNPALASYVAELYAISTGSNIGLVDINARFGSWVAANALGFMASVGLNGDIHPSAAGNADIAAALFAALTVIS